MTLINDRNAHLLPTFTTIMCGSLDTLNGAISSLTESNVIDILLGKSQNILNKIIYQQFSLNNHEDSSIPVTKKRRLKKNHSSSKQVLEKTNVLEKPVKKSTLVNRGLYLVKLTKSILFKAVYTAASCPKSS